MANCRISKHCLFERRVLKVRIEYVDGIERKCSSSLIRSYLGNVEVIMHCLPFYPMIEIRLNWLGYFESFFSKFEYRRDYGSYLNFVLSDGEPNENEDDFVLW
jgi:hypothetical protein